MASPHFRLALLECSRPLPTTLGKYRRVYQTWLDASLEIVNASRTEAEPVTYTLDGYDVVDEVEYPPDGIEYHGILITGSPSSAYEDLEWINRLITYVKRIISEKPNTKLFGICFGHQIIARALGAECTPNDGKWEVAVTTVQLTPLGKSIFGKEELDVQQLHRDHVPTVPSGCHLLGSTAITPNHGFVMFDSNSTPSAESLDSESLSVSLTSIRIFTVQGHPEFTPITVHAVLDARAKILGEVVTREARTRADGLPGKPRSDGRACDGVSVVGRTIWGILGVA
ncbi:class I glutamine amidotransferase-like protein [Pisolithus albus]|nr:class I glutamine amidotransferase-like protein [Pisolithus albus]